MAAAHREVGEAVDFTFDAEQLALQDVARTALERECDPQMVRTLVDEPTGMTPALWSTLVDLGWTGLFVPAALGGTGTGLLELTIVAEQMGRLPLPGPFFSSAVAATLAALDPRRHRARGRPGRRHPPGHGRPGGTGAWRPAGHGADAGPPQGGRLGAQRDQAVRGGRPQRGLGHRGGP